MSETIRDNGVLLQADFPDLQLYASGKVRDIYKVDANHLLFVATDRISAFDYVLATGIPQKGRVLTQLSMFWFEFLKDIVPNHLATADIDQYPAELQKYADKLRGRSMLVVAADMVPSSVSCGAIFPARDGRSTRIAARSAASSYLQGCASRTACPSRSSRPPQRLPAGTTRTSRSSAWWNWWAKDLSEQLRDLSIRIYKTAADYAETRGIIIADTKFEFGRTPKGLVLADEVLTPDSSRFWPMDKYHPGGAQESFDKQYVRDYLESIRWNKQPPAPGLPAEVAARTSEKYIEAYTQLTGHPLPE